MTYTRKDTQIPTPGSRKPPVLKIRPRFAGLSRSAAALFRVGTYRARMAAALMIVAGSLLYQTGAEALEQSSKKVLYLDAPSVSVPQAEKAGETARGYAGPDSNVDNTVLAWVDVKPVPRQARKAFASIADPSGQPPGGVSYDDAVAAGDTMVAQLGGDSPAPSAGENDELASADPVRPKLGDGTKATDAPVLDDAGRQPNPASGPEPVVPESGSQDLQYAGAGRPAPSDLGLPAPMAEEYAPEPSTEPPAEQPPDSNGSELAAVPEDGPEATEEGAGGNSDTGPISDDYTPEAASPDPSDGSPGSADETAPRDETEFGSSDAGPDPQEDEASPTIIVPDSPASDEPEQEPEQEYAAVPEGSGTEPETSETPESETEPSNPENTATPQDELSDEIPDEASSDPSSEPSPASTGEESVPAQDTSPGTDEQESDESSDLVAVVPYDPGMEEGQDDSQEGLEPSSQPPAETPAEPSSGPPSEETESDSPDPEPGQQKELPEQAAATPTPAGEEPAGEGPAVQTETEFNAELGAGEDSEDMGTDEELPEGVQIESSDEDGFQKLSVVVHQESETTDTPAANSPDAQETPEESAPSEPSESEYPSPASQGKESRPSNGPDASTNSEAEQVPKPNNAKEPNLDQSDDAPERRPVEHTARGNNAGDDSPVPQETTGNQQQSAPEASPEPSAGADQIQPETTTDPKAGNEANEPGTTPANQSRQGNQPPDQERVSKQDSQIPAPAPAPAPKVRAPRPNTEGAGQGTQSNDQVQGPTQSRDDNQDKQRSPQPEQQQPSQPAREPRQSTAPAKASPAKASPAEQGGNTGVQGPTQSADAVPISAQPEPVPARAEPVPAQESEPPTPTAATNTPQSNEATPALQNQPVVTTEPVAQPPAASQAEPEVAPEPAPAVQPAVQTYADPATEEVADPAGWEDPTQAQAAGQTARQINQAVNQATGQVFTQPIDAAPQSYAEPAVEQGWDQVTLPAAGSVQGQWTADTGVPGQAYPAQDAGTQVSGMVDAVNQVGQVDSYVQEVVGTAPEIPISPENIADPYANSYVEPSTEPSTVPAANSYETPAVQDAAGAVEDVAQEGYAQEPVSPNVEDVAANAAPASQPASQPVSEPVTYGGAVDSTSYDDPGAITETYADPAPAEPVTQVPTQQLEPVQQVPTQELAPAPQAANVLESGPAAATPSAVPTGAASSAPSPAPAQQAPAQQAQQQAATTVDTVVQQTIGAGDVTGGVAGSGK